MIAVIMAGGEGSRLRPLTCDRPKPLVPICNRPVMGYILDLLVEHGFQEVFITLGYRPAPLSRYFGDRYRGMRLRYVVEESPLGTAGSVAALRENLTEPFLVVSGDALTDFDLTALVDWHRQQGAVATLALARKENPLEYGVVMTDRQGRIRRFLEKPGWGEVFSDTVNTGIYVLDPRILTGVPAGRSYDFSQHLFPALLRMEAPLYAQVMDGYWCDIGDPKAYVQANMDLVAGRLRFPPPGREVAPGVWAMREIPEGVLVDGPALIGEGCHLAPGTRLEAGVVLGPATVTGPGAVLRRTVTWSGVHIEAEATLVGAVVCEGTALGKAVGVFEGAVLGPNCSVGDQALISPGVRLWPRTEVAPGAQVDCTLVQSPVWSGRVLRHGGLTGRLGSDLFPETALRVGTAFGAVLSGPGPVVVGCDPGSAASLLKQALLCGVLAAGRQALDVGVTASPVTEFAVREQRAAGGIHVRSDRNQARAVFYDAEGRLLSRGLQRKLEQACQRQDFHRAEPETAGAVEWFGQAERSYVEYLSEQVDVAAVRAGGLRVAVEGEAWPLLHRWLDHLGVERSGDGRDYALRLRLDLLAGSWQIVAASPEEMLALDAWLQLRCATAPDEVVPIPVTAPRGVEAMLRHCGRRPLRVRLADWQPQEPLLAIGRLLALMANEGLSERDVLAQLPSAHWVERRVECPWEAKGRVMRRLLEEEAERILDLVDGVRIESPDGWALLVPDPEEPVYQVYAEAESLAQAAALAEEYAGRVSRWVDP